MAIAINTALQNRQADSMADAFDAGVGDGVLQIRSGGAPGPNNAASGTLLASVTLPATAFGAAASGTASKAGTWEDLSIDASGTAAHFRMQDSDGTFVMEGTVTATSGGGDMEVDDTSFVAGGTFTVTSFSITQPAS